MIIITGATGFIGSNLAADLNQQGRTDLLLVDDLGTQGKWKNIAKRRFLDLIDYRKLHELLPTLAQADAVFHMGADSSTTSTDGDKILEVNLRASMAWWQWCANTGTPFIYASSAATYGDGQQGFDDGQETAELDRLAPLNLYGWSKHQFDKWAIERAAEGKAPPQWAGLKFFNVYGPNEYHKADMRSLVAKNTGVIARGEPVRLFKSYKQGCPDGGQLRDFVYVKDCTAVMTWLQENQHVSGLFNLGTGQARSFADLMHAIGSALNQPVQVEFVDMPESIRPNYQYFTEARMDKLRCAGFNKAFHSMEEGVADYVQHHLQTSDPFR
ncbi:ADP-glyceromanno-heptose 6-epimerase [Aquabacterium soli]|uniref:ADP-L-glycero-D-manno-heptose-6-epimerase n=1 Tax=Aquabacterium soli TaxID=2493092 RepID=A0A426VC11_9BURK|nr:ADP-glyceromanno-heptose 6-epimerase [Aquabacterium soli]RRS04370.1 ADP-glyceromanno-heptose 6-epimerase [Aquabacterium soli]